ncbi:hypothetical protein GCM10017776_36280 [Streptomyces griseoluteus]|nr:hypothetical protein GCM10017776_36280 [Streptomyces griseoluteus]
MVSGLAFAMLAGSFISAPNASAAGDCNTWKSSSAPWTGYAYCSKMGITDKFRVKVTCMGPDGKTWVAYGPWTGNTGTSKKKCADDPNIGVYKVGISFDH